MKRFLFDTNIYGELVLDAQFELLKEKIKLKCIVHGFAPVRQELRDVPKKVRIEGGSLRLSLLHLYDELIKKVYPLTPKIEALSTAYYQTYRELGGSRSFDKQYIDFCVVACATIHQIDIVVSEDNKSILVENSLKAYDLVNIKQGKKTPQFIGYLKLKRLLDE